LLPRWVMWCGTPSTTTRAILGIGGCCQYDTDSVPVTDPTTVPVTDPTTRSCCIGTILRGGWRRPAIPGCFALHAHPRWRPDRTLSF
jgi:hypothetical protein